MKPLDKQDALLQKRLARFDATHQHPDKEERAIRRQLKRERKRYLRNLGKREVNDLLDDN